MGQSEISFNQEYLERLQRKLEEQRLKHLHETA